MTRSLCDLFPWPPAGSLAPLGLSRTGLLRAVDFAELVQLGLCISHSALGLLLSPLPATLAGVAHTLTTAAVTQFSHLRTPERGTFEEQGSGLHPVAHHLHMEFVLALLQCLLRFSSGQPDG